jgi:hypothetical protein
MNPDTGEIKNYLLDEYLVEQERRKTNKLRPLVSVGKSPDPNCKLCKGKGSILIGKTRKRWKPCKCTKVNYVKSS